MKSLDSDKKSSKTSEAAPAASEPTTSVSAESVQLDLSKVKIEPLFEEFVDFDTFAKSDFRVVKIEACEAVPKSKKLLKFTLNDGTDKKRTILSGIHEYYEPEQLVGKTFSYTITDEVGIHARPAGLLEIGRASCRERVSSPV